MDEKKLKIFALLHIKSKKEAKIQHPNEKYFEKFRSSNSSRVKITP